MDKIKNFFSKFLNKGVLLAVVSGVLGVLIALDIISPEQQEVIMDNAEYLLGLLAALGLFQGGKEIKDNQKKKKARK